jgi:hypothetical protein
LATAGPAFAATRLPPVPLPKGRVAVSPDTTETFASSTPSSAAAICAIVVSCACPWDDTPMITCTLPAVSTRTSAPS